MVRSVFQSPKCFVQGALSLKDNANVKLAKVYRAHQQSCPDSHMATAVDTRVDPGSFQCPGISILARHVSMLGI
ncbi:hypothetical protein HYQ46_001458 [Verticillium longisporum]|nr:hypothetical protein HYQ46_001458 [Verticillium longisporum]